MGRLRDWCVAVLGTFTLVRVFDWCVPAVHPGVSRGLPDDSASRHHQVRQMRTDELQQQAAMSTRVTAAAASAPALAAAAATAAAASAVASSASASTAATAEAREYFIVIGFPVGIDKRNTDRRQLLRDLWVPQYPNLGRTVRYEFLIGLLTYQAEGHDEATVDALFREHTRYGDLALLNAREATKDPYRGDPKCTGEKIVAWFQRTVVAYRSAKFFVKADWDTWIHVGRLEVNFRRLLAERPAEPLYIGNTLWCSYSLADYQPCGYGFGPLQAAGARTVECPLLPHGRDAVGPFPYAAGLFWAISYDVMQWIAGSRLVNDFVHNASARFEPPYWVKGEDSAFGFFVHVSPFAKLTPIHWGWETVHDGWEFRSKAERGLCTQHITNTTLAVHSMHTVKDFEFARDELKARCDGACEQRRLPFTVDGLKDLCGRNPNIAKVYSKCAAVGYPDADPTKHRKLELRALPRPKCQSVGANVPFIAAAAQGGTINCHPDPSPSYWDQK